MILPLFLFLELFDSFGYCQFTSTSSSSCLMVNEMTRPNKWVLAKRTCRYENGLRRVITEYQKIPSVPLRDATLGANFFHGIQISVKNDTADTGTAYGSYQSDLADFPCYVGEVSYSMVLELNPPLLTRRQTSGLIVTDATLEVGSFSSSYARYIKFAPVGAAAYALFVAGHCLPDPPGHLHVVGNLHPHNIGEVNRNYCMDLRSTVKCDKDRFRFTVRIRFYMAHSPLLQGVIRLLNKGVYTSVCPGEYLSSTQRQSITW